MSLHFRGLRPAPPRRYLIQAHHLGLLHREDRPHRVNHHLGQYLGLRQYLSLLQSLALLLAPAQNPPLKAPTAPPAH